MLPLLLLRHLKAEPTDDFLTVPNMAIWEGREGGRVTESVKDRTSGTDAHVCVSNDSNRGNENHNQENYHFLSPGNLCVLVNVSCDGSKLPEGITAFLSF